MAAKCDFNEKKISNIKYFLDVNVDFCIKSGMKSYSAYKQKAINEISKDNIFIVKLPKSKDIFYEKMNVTKEKEKNFDMDNYWYFLACYTNSVHLRNYVILFYTNKYNY